MANRPGEVPPVGACSCDCGCGDTGPWRALAWMYLCDHCYGYKLRSQHAPSMRKHIF